MGITALIFTEIRHDRRPPGDLPEDVQSLVSEDGLARVSMDALAKLSETYAIMILRRDDKLTLRLDEPRKRFRQWG